MFCMYNFFQQMYFVVDMQYKHMCLVWLGYILDYRQP